MRNARPVEKTLKKPRKPAAIDWGAVASHARAVAGAQPRRERPAPEGLPQPTPDQVRAFRARASHLAHRLPADSLVDAAWGGLQDSAPRAGLLALHARAHDVAPTSWEDPALAQIWFRGADYVVPRESLAVFTLGASPREPRYDAALRNLAEALGDALEGPTSPGDAITRIGGMPNQFFVRAAQVYATFTIRWDARTVTMLPNDPPSVDVEEARLELARRFLRWAGPTQPQRFARWAGVSAADAEQTWAALRPELIEVALHGHARWILAEDLDALVDARPERGVRLLPSSDPYLVPDPLVGQREPQLDLPGLDRKLVNSLAAGRVLLDGALVASWGRKGNRLSIAPWGGLHPGNREEIEAEGASMAGPIGSTMRIEWLTSPND